MDDFQQTLIKRYAAGETAREIAASIDVHESTLGRWFTKWGVPTRNGGAKPHFDPAERAALIKRYQDGESISSLAHPLGVSHTWLNQQLQSWGLQKRTRSEAVALANQRNPRIQGRSWPT